MSVARVWVAVVLCVLLVAACSTRGGGGPSQLPDAGFGDTGTVVVDAGTDAGPVIAVDGGPSLETVLIYAHSRDTLFTFSPYTLTVEEVGMFSLPGGSEAPLMLDLAVNADGGMYTASAEALFEVDPDTAEVTKVGDFRIGEERLFALSFLAPGEYRDSEALIGATNEGVYYLVDPDTARTTSLGRYPDGWASSGDIVSVEGLGTYATVKRDDYPSDVLVQIFFAADGSSTATVRGPVRDSSTDYAQIFGLGYWGRDLYGFSNAGQLIRIDRNTGAGELTTAETGTDQFWGAGVTTQVPFIF